MVRIERLRQRRRWVQPAPGEPEDRQSQYGDADGFVACEHAELFQRRQILGERREGELHDDQHDDGPMQQLGDDTPAVWGISDDHGAKLMRVTASCKLRLPGVALLAVLLTGCPLQPRLPAAPPVAAAETPAPHEGIPYDIVADESLFTIRVYRGGTLASAGHNHLIAAHDLSRTIYVPADPLLTSLQTPVPVAALTVDET